MDPSLELGLLDTPATASKLFAEAAARLAPLDLWVAPVPDQEEEALALAQLTLLDAQERLQMRRFRTATLQRRYRTTRALVRTVLSRYASLAPSQWVFKASSHGRPYVDPPAGATRTPRFNVTHTEQLVVMLVGFGRELGVDVEAVSRNVPMAVVGNFAEPERRALARLPAAARASRFWDYWTLKESYIKARGLGLSIPLDEFYFSFETEDRITLTIHPTLEDRADRWRFWQLALPDDHRLAVCAEAVPPCSNALRGWWTVPARHAAPLELQYLRWSA